MSKEVVLLISYFIFFGWILILAIAKSITMIMVANKCSKCTCKKCWGNDDE